jgi:hypothetical protein
MKGNVPALQGRLIKPASRTATIDSPFGYRARGLRLTSATPGRALSIGHYEAILRIRKPLIPMGRHGRIGRHVRRVSMTDVR